MLSAAQTIWQLTCKILAKISKISCQYCATRAHIQYYSL